MKNLKALLLIYALTAYSASAQLYTPSGAIQGSSGGLNVGIGTSSASAKLQVRSASTDVFVLNPIEEWQGVIGGGQLVVEPDFAFRVERRSEVSMPQISTNFSITPSGRTQVGRFGWNTSGDMLAIRDAVGVYKTEFDFIKFNYDMNQPQLSWGSNTDQSSFEFVHQGTGDIPLTLSPRGKVGINTNNFFDNHSLIVEGSVHIRDDGEDLHSLNVEGRSISEELWVQKGNDWGQDDNFVRLLYGVRPEFRWQSSSGESLEFKSGNETPLRLSPQGKVGVNTNNFFDSHELYVNGSVYLENDEEEEHTLWVEGSMIAEEVVVKLASAWPDYVFTTDYKRMHLLELDRYISLHKRLPGMPDAEAVERDGVKMGETVRILTEKVEEISLYLIELKKENESLKQEIEALKKNN